ncbi:MAG: DUF2520 domain-containing protein [Flavobacteriaceae bacterium]|nr:DUF2520 domain-containing protein [Flavobacteriaceae bacterium]
MIKVILLGSGNVAVHLAKAFVKNKNIDFIQRFGRSNSNVNFFDKTIPVIHKISELKPADVYLIAIFDDAISDFSKQLKFNQGLVVHTSGNKSLNTLQCNANKGVFYPLQTFSKEQKVDFKKIPIAFETEQENDFILLEKLAKLLSNETYNIDTEQRKKLHIAAVFANNFTNQMYKIAKDICEEHYFSFDILKPLIQETANKLLTLSPEKSQTGPAKRSDEKVIENHLQQLSKNQKEIYKLLTKSIIDTHK